MQQDWIYIPISIPRRCTPPCGLHLRSNAFAQQRNSPHSRPVDQFSSACSRSQMRLSTCPAPHSSPGGLRLCSSAFARWCKATGCIRSRLPSVQKGCSCICRSFLPGAAPPDSRALPAVRIRARLYHNRTGLQSQSDEAQHLSCTALQPWRASFVQQCFRQLVHGNRLHPQQVAFCAEMLQLYVPLFSTRCRTPALKGFVCTRLLSLLCLSAPLQPSLR